MTSAPTESPRRKPGRPRRLSDRQVEELRLLAEGGATHAALAARFGISRPLVSMITRGERYADAPGPITYRYTTDNDSE